MDKVTQFCKKNKIFLIEDCALALGSRFKKHVGLFGEIGAFSFYPVKHITTAEGGMVISKNKKMIDKVKNLKHLVMIDLLTKELFLECMTSTS